MAGNGLQFFLRAALLSLAAASRALSAPRVLAIAGHYHPQPALRQGTSSAVAVTPARLCALGHHHHHPRRAAHQGAARAHAAPRGLSLARSRTHPSVMAASAPVASPLPRAVRKFARAVRRGLFALWLRICSRIAKGVEDYRRNSRPAQIFLMRHGESKGNVNETLYSIIADHSMELTQRGYAQARCAGSFLRALTGDGPMHCFHSPYRRAAQTLDEMVKAFDPSMLAIREDPLLREQEFGNFQDVELIRRSKAERRRFGRFWYRFPNGESGADVHNRAADFLSTLFRQMDLSDKRAPHYMILAHGLFIRLFCMRYLGWTVGQFEQVWNPANCEIWQLDRQADGRYYLAAAYQPRQRPDGVRAHGPVSAAG